MKQHKYKLDSISSRYDFCIPSRYHLLAPLLSNLSLNFNCKLENILRYVLIYKHFDVLVVF